MKNKMFATFGVLMVALSVAGFAYAHWTDAIYMYGEVHMGELIFGFTEKYGCWDGKMDYYATIIDYEIIKPEPKPVGELEFWFEEPETSVHLDPPKTVYKRMYVNITNAYPEYVAWFNYSLDNGGTIPLDVYNYCVTVNTDIYLDYYWEDTDGDGYLDTLVGHNPNGDAVINIWFEPLPANNQPFLGQIDPCDHVDQTMFIHIKEPAEECHTYFFEIVIHSWQWDP
jgi:hypothetical protein